jgi:hypothetical protein
MRDCGYSCLKSDPCVYICREGDNLAIVTVWVDDLLLFTSTHEEMERMKSQIKEDWEVTDLGEPSKIVGIEITLRERSVTISQQRYIESILKREGLDQANAVSMPLDPNITLELNPDGNDGDRSNSFASVLGELQFLANATRPDIAFMVNRLGSFTTNLSIQHITALKRVLRYLSRTRGYGITYSDVVDHPNLFHGFSDAAHANGVSKKVIK